MLFFSGHFCFVSFSKQLTVISKSSGFHLQNPTFISKTSYCLCFFRNSCANLNADKQIRFLPDSFVPDFFMPEKSLYLTLCGF